MPTMQLPQYPNDRPSAEDIERAKRLGPGECPRRYCQFWRSSAFEWEFPVKAGCIIGGERGKRSSPDGYWRESWKDSNGEGPHIPFR